MTHSLPAFSSKRFAPAVGQAFSWRVFELTGTVAAIKMTLTKLVLRPSPAHAEQFSLLFVGPSDAALEQGTYTISNDVTGAEAVFAVPIGPDASGLRQYEVIVSRELEAWEVAVAGSGSA